MQEVRRKNNFHAKWYRLNCLTLLLLVACCCHAQESVTTQLAHLRDLYKSGDYDKAVALLTENDDRMNDKRYGDTIAPDCEMIAYLYYLHGNYVQSVYYYNLNLAYQIDNKRPPMDIARSLVGLGEAMDESGHSDVSLQYYATAERLISMTDVKNPLLADVHSRIAYIQYISGNFSLAKKHYMLAWEMAAENPEMPLYIKKMVIGGLGYCTFMLHDYKSSLAYHQAFIRLGGSEPIELNNHRARMALCYLYLGDTARSMEYLNIVLRNYQGLYHPEIDQNIGQLCYLLGKYNPAEYYLNRALKRGMDAHGANHPGTARAYYLIGNYYISVKNPDSALAYFGKGLNSISGMEDASGISSVPGSTEYLSHMIPMLEKTGLACYYKSQSDTGSTIYWLQRSLLFYQSAVRWTTYASSKYLSEEGRLNISQSSQDVCTGAIRVCRQLYVKSRNRLWLDEAFRFAEQGRAGALLSAINESIADDDASSNSLLAGADRTIKARIWRIESMLYDSRTVKDKARVLQLRKKLLELYNIRDKIRHYRKGNPEFSSVMEMISQIPSATLISKNIPDDVVFIEYALADTVLHTFLLNSKGAHWFCQKIDKSFYLQLDHFRSMVSTPVYISDSSVYADLIRTGRLLSDLLVKPCLEEIDDKARLFISPDPAMGAVSFESLIISDKGLNAAQCEDYRNPDYLFKTHPITYQYSASVYLKMIRNSKPAGGGTVVFVPDYSHCESNQVPGELLFTKDEVQILGDDYDAEILEGSDANPSAFSKLAPVASILHLAMHARLNEQEPLHSSLIFNDTEGNCTNINASDIYGMVFSNDITVIAACNSGFGKTAYGEGMLSLSRAFIHAGSQSVLASMWPASDETSSLLMKQFYIELSSGYTADVALQKARLQLLERSNSISDHPAFWANYILQGRASSLQESGGAIPVSEIVFGIFAILLILTDITAHVIRMFFLTKKSQKTVGI